MGNPFKPAKPASLSGRELFIQRLAKDLSAGINAKQGLETGSVIRHNSPGVIATPASH